MQDMTTQPTPAAHGLDEPRRGAKRLALVALVALAVLAGVAIAVGARMAGRPASPAESALVPDNTIQLIVGGLPQPFKQGSVVPVTGNLYAQLKLRAAEAVFLRKFDLFLYQDTPQAPYDRATVEVRGVMPDMTHSDFTLNVDSVGAGHYSVILPCGMNGQWEFDIQVNAEGKRGSIRLLVDVYE